MSEDGLATGSQRVISAREAALWAVLILVGVAVAWLAGGWLRPPPPRMDAPLFQLVDQNGKNFAEGALKGEPYLLFFGFNTCGDVCPATLQRITALKAQIGAEAKNLKVVYVTTDPGRDTPAGMKDYLTNFDAPIIGLTGGAGKIAEAERAFRVSVETIPFSNGGYSIIHGTTTFLMDRRGRILTTIGPEESRDNAVNKLKALLEG